MATSDYLVPGTEWEYEWWHAKDYINKTLNNEFTGLLLPSPATCYNNSDNPVEEFTWYHLAPAMGFKISRDGSKIKITPLPVTEYTDGTYGTPIPYNHYAYSDGWTPKITFSYKDSSGNYQTIATFETESDYTGSAKSSSDITGINVAGIYVTCGASSCGLYNKQNILAYVKLHNHISAPSAPTIDSTTGKTIKVTNGQDGIYCTTNSKGWYTSPYIFTELSQGSSYSFKCKKICPDCPESKEFESTTVIGRTWSISGSYVNSGAKSITYKATHVAGTGGNADDKTITYKLYASKSTSGTVIATKTGNNGVPVTFTDIDPGKTYYCYAYTTNLGNGDNNCWISGTTKTATSISGAGGDVSATTLRSSVSWNAGGATSVSCTVSCNGSTKSLSTSGGYVGFTGLTPGINYTVSYKVVSTYTYTYEYKVKENGEEVTKQGSRTDTIETTGSNSYTTKKSQFGDPINVTSKIIQFKSSSNYSGDTMEQKISTTNWESIAQDTYVIYNNLTHNTSYTIYCRINGCYAYDGSGNKTSVNDSEISQTVNTHLLSLVGSINEEHQHSLVTLWQAYVNNESRDSDAIDDTSFGFIYMDTLARKNNPPYQASEVIEGSNGNTTGIYQSDKRVYSNNLTWYYCEYIVTVSITDGYNVVTNTVIAHTIFPATWMFTGGQWHRYMPHVYTNSKWVPAPAFIYSNNKFIEPKGE